ncbi:MAG TPA: SlyX family protein [Sphaerochaeta sp.]|nr:SlyX family protein [Sphaerochaeta sp.]
MDERLMNLEIKLAYAEETVLALDAVVRTQAQEIALVLNRLEKLDRRVTALVENNEDGLPDNERPPHY